MTPIIQSKDRKCPRCGETVLSMPTHDGNIIGLCRHVWPMTKADE